MIHPLLYGNPYYLLLSFIMISYASFTMMSMIDHGKPTVNRPSIQSLLGASIVFSLGLWTMHIVSLLASDYMLIVDWSMLANFGVCSLMTLTGLLILYRSPKPSRVSEGIAAFLMACAAILLPYTSILSNAIHTFSVNFLMLALSLATSFTGTYTALIMLRKKPPFYKTLGSLVVGIASVSMHQLGLYAITVEYRDILTTELFNKYLLLLAFILCMTTLLIISFSLTAWFSIRKYAAIDERYKLLVENSMDTIALIKEGRWEYLNPSGLQLFEASNEKELIGNSVFELLDPKHHPCISEWLESEWSEGGQLVKPVELLWRTLQGKLVYTELVRVRASFYGAPLEQVIIRDITERKKNEELLINAEKLSIAGQLAAGIAHEIRNPLTSLKGFMQLIASGKIHNNHYYSIMKSELVRIETIISELLMLSKPQVYEYSHIDLRELIHESVGHLDSHAKQFNVRMDCETHSHPTWVLGVESQLKQVFINLIKNAIESMQEGGVVTIKLSLKDNETVSVRIQDEGVGIPREQLSKIGQPFYTTKDKGTGLGLMVTYKIINNHEGHIVAESEPGVGTTFTVQLPYRCPIVSKLALVPQRA
ncbi:ATP-binding protein [Paenibacillus sp. GCM10027627]|uniref:ATP-binding protein n=1 Tax=unclassified Paenibacillus TaxID=185978 RepID=UPI0036282424